MFTAKPARDTMDSVPKIDWREYGVKTIRADQLDSDTPQTLGMNCCRHIRAQLMIHLRRKRFI
jgi:hypothetical protein